jgi:hypothetical protein
MGFNVAGNAVGKQVEDAQLVRGGGRSTRFSIKRDRSDLFPVPAADWRRRQQMVAVPRQVCFGMRLRACRRVYVDVWFERLGRVTLRVETSCAPVAKRLGPSIIDSEDSDYGIEPIGDEVDNLIKSRLAITRDAGMLP